MGFCEFYGVVERGLHRGLFGWDLSSPRDGDAGEGLRNEEAIPGAQLPGSFGMYIKLSRGTALRVAANAGDIASRIGKASVAPTPRRNDRRSSAILVMNICVPSFPLEKILISFALKPSAFSGAPLGFH